MFRNRSPRAAGFITFILFIVVFVILIAIVTLISPDVLLPAFVYQLFGFIVNWSFWIAVVAGVIVYFWKRGQEE